MQLCASGLKHYNMARSFQHGWSFDKNHKVAHSLKQVDDVGHLSSPSKIKRLLFQPKMSVKGKKKSRWHRRRES